MIDRGEVDRAPLILTAGTQTGGFGRLGRRWSSPRGGLWCTIITRHPPAPPIPPGLSVAAGLATLEAVELAAGADADRLQAALKWPNDVLDRGRKLAGVLVEVIPRPGAAFTLIGIGINANCGVHELATDLHDRATTLRTILGRDIDLPALRDTLASAVIALHDPAACRLAIAAAARRLAGIGEPRAVRLPSEEIIEGTVRGLRDDGALELQLPGGELRALTTGEVGDAATP